MKRERDNYRCAACVRYPMALPLEVAVKGGMLDVVDKFCHLGDTMTCVGGVEGGCQGKDSQHMEEVEGVDRLVGKSG